MKKQNKLIIYFLTFVIFLSGITIQVSANEGLSVKRLYGPTRVETAIKVSEEIYKDKSTKNVVLAGSKGEIDALTGTLFASSQDAPLLLLNRYDQLIKNELNRLGVKNVYLLGGESTINKTVEGELESAGYIVKRLAGKNRLDTAVKIAKEVKNEASHVFLANDGRSGSLADALAVGPVSGRDQVPILLTAKNKLPDATFFAMKELKVSRVTIVGGTGVVSNKVKEKLESTGYKVDRIAGKNRWHTAKLIAESNFQGVSQAIVANDGRSGSFADALMGGYLGAKINAPIVLTDTNRLNPDTKSYLAANSPKITLLGGEKVVSSSVHRSLQYPNEVSAEDANYIGNRNTKVFHRLTCRALPHQKNRVYFEERKDASETGFVACKICKP